MPLARVNAPFDHPDWIYELKYDGFRALAYIENRVAHLVSRNRNRFEAFPDSAGLTDDGGRLNFIVVFSA